MKKRLVFTLFIILGLFTEIQTAWASKGHGDDDGREYRSHSGRHGYSYGDRYYHRSYPQYFSLPDGYLTVKLISGTYYYWNGAFYQYTPSGYVVVPAPPGAIVEELPRQHKRFVHRNQVYFFYNNSYYVHEPEGYVVINPPPEVITQNSVAVESPEKTIVVTVPNPNGSYIPVILKKYSDGYMGPNGEFYPEYPSIDQLKTMYSIASAKTPQPLPEGISFEVSNKNGSVTKVVLNRTQDGYVGPEGEYYKEKPTIKQLEEMYAK